MARAVWLFSAVADELDFVSAVADELDFVSADGARIRVVPIHVGSSEWN